MTSHLATPKDPYALSIPPSQATVMVRVIDSTTTIHINPELFWKPNIKGLDLVKAPIYCFLISNGDRHILFDLGVRRDWEKYAPRTVALIKATTVVQTEKNVSEILDDDTSGLGIRSKDIEAVIWSHGHFDHIGDPATFPPSTELIVGAGIKDQLFPGYPTRPDAIVLDADVSGRRLREIDVKKESQGLRIGRFDAMDFFGDGSFYLLDAPGHAIGHVCGLARVTASPDSFVLMGADACHHPGVLRPTEYLPLPETVSPSPLSYFRKMGQPCPGAVLRQLHTKKTASEPFFTVCEKLFPEYEDALDTVKKIEELDADDRIFVIIAHDESLLDQIDLFPKSINDWMAKGLKSKTCWLFCKDFDGCL